MVERCQGVQRHGEEKGYRGKQEGTEPRGLFGITSDAMRTDQCQTVGIARDAFEGRGRAVWAKPEGP